MAGPAVGFAQETGGGPSSGPGSRSLSPTPYFQNDGRRLSDSSATDEEREREIKLKVDEMAQSIPKGTFVGGKTFADLAVFEKKSVLINRELDAMGMGKYQWCVFLLCGFGYFLDLAWAQAFALVAVPIREELGVPPGRIADLSIAFNTGLTVGAFTWGILVDILGRKWCFNLTCLIASVFGFLFATPSNYTVICFFAAMIGFGVGGNVPIDATITIEFLPNNRRFLLAALSTFQPIGVVFASVMAYRLIPKYSCATGLPSCSTGEIPCCTRGSNLGWRYTMIVLGCITLGIFVLRFVVFRFRESPKFLLSKGQDVRAIDILYSVAKFNGKVEPKITMEDFQALDMDEAQRISAMKPSFTNGDSTVDLSSGTLSRGAKAHIGAKEVTLGYLTRTFGHLRKLFADRHYAYIFVVLTIAYMAFFWSFSVAGYFLPILLRAKGIEKKLSTADTYLQYVWIYLPGVTATFVASGLMELPRVGRKWGMVLSSALMGVALAMYQVVNSIPASIGFNAMEYWFQSLYGALLYAFTPESFPSTVRGSASGMLSTLGRISSIIAPVAAGRAYTGGDSPGILWLGAGAAWVSTLAIVCLPYDTKGKQTY